MPAPNETTAERIDPWWHGGHRTSANPCCSVIEPCSTQRAAPYAVCESCFRAAALAPEPARPTAWMRGIYQPSTLNGPAEHDVDLVYGDDRPDGEGWVPLYRAALAPTPAPEPVEMEAIEKAFNSSRSADWQYGVLAGLKADLSEREQAHNERERMASEALALIRKAIAQPAAQEPVGIDPQSLLATLMQAKRELWSAVDTRDAVLTLEAIAQPAAAPFGTFVERADGTTEFRRHGEPHTPTAQSYKAWTLFAQPDAQEAEVVAALEPIWQRARTPGADKVPDDATVTVFMRDCREAARVLGIRVPGGNAGPDFARPAPAAPSDNAYLMALRDAITSGDRESKPDHETVPVRLGVLRHFHDRDQPDAPGAEDVQIVKDLRQSVEWLANNIRGVSLVDWDDHSNAVLAAADRLEALARPAPPRAGDEAAVQQLIAAAEDCFFSVPGERLQKAIDAVRRRPAPDAQGVGEASASDAELVDALIAECCADYHSSPTDLSVQAMRTDLLARLSRQTSASDNVDFLLTRLVEQQDEINRLRTVQQWDRRLLRLSRQPSAAAPRVEDGWRDADRAPSNRICDFWLEWADDMVDQSRLIPERERQFRGMRRCWSSVYKATYWRPLPPVPDRIATTPGEGR